MSFSTHVLDTSRGCPSRGARAPGNPFGHARGVTDADGRWRLETPLQAGRHRLVLETEFASDFFPEVAIVFAVADDRHHHVPLLLSPFGYSTYRGS